MRLISLLRLKITFELFLIPLLNPDGRERVPVIMESHKGASKDSYIVHEYLNTGGKPDGTLIGWPDVKEYLRILVHIIYPILKY